MIKNTKMIILEKLKKNKIKYISKLNIKKKKLKQKYEDLRRRKIIFFSNMYSNKYRSIRLYRASIKNLTIKSVKIYMRSLLSSFKNNFFLKQPTYLLKNNSTGEQSKNGAFFFTKIKKNLNKKAKKLENFALVKKKLREDFNDCSRVSVAPLEKASWKNCSISKEHLFYSFFAINDTLESKKLKFNINLFKKIEKFDESLLFFLVFNFYQSVIASRILKKSGVGLLADKKSYIYKFLAVKRLKIISKFSHEFLQSSNYMIFENNFFYRRPNKENFTQKFKRIPLFKKNKFLITNQLETNLLNFFNRIHRKSYISNSSRVFNNNSSYKKKIFFLKKFAQIRNVLHCAINKEKNIENLEYFNLVYFLKKFKKSGDSWKLLLGNEKANFFYNFTGQSGCAADIAAGGSNSSNVESRLKFDFFTLSDNKNVLEWLHSSSNASVTVLSREDSEKKINFFGNYVFLSTYLIFDKILNNLKFKFWNKEQTFKFLFFYKKNKGFLEKKISIVKKNYTMRKFFMSNKKSSIILKNKLNNYRPQRSGSRLFLTNSNKITKTLTPLERNSHVDILGKNWLKKKLISSKNLTRIRDTLKNLKSSKKEDTNMRSYYDIDSNKLDLEFTKNKITKKKNRWRAIDFENSPFMQALEEGAKKIKELSDWRRKRGLVARRRRFYFQRKSMKYWRSLSFLKSNYFNKPFLLKSNWNNKKVWNPVFFFNYASRYLYFKNKYTIRLYFLSYLSKRKNSQLKSFLRELSYKRQKLLIFFNNYESRLDNFLINWGYLRNLTIMKSRFLIKNGFVYVNFKPIFFFNYTIKKNDCVTLTYFGLSEFKQYYYFKNIGATKWRKSFIEHRNIHKFRKRGIIKHYNSRYFFYAYRYLKVSHWTKKYFTFFFRFFETSPIVKVFVYFYFYSWFSYKFSKFLNYLWFSQRINSIFLNTRLF